MSNEEPRKSTDIILSLEEKVDKLTKIVSVYDMNIKIILDRVNKIYSYIQMLESEMLNEKQTATQQPEIIQTEKEHIIPVSTAPIGNIRTARTEPVPSQPIIPAIPVQQEQISMAKPSNGKKVPVIQRVTDDKGKDLFYAEVSILNEQNELVMKTKTNANGKWQAYLEEGLYKVNIVKTDTSTHRKLEAMQDININDVSKPITLPVIIIKR